MKRYFFLVFAIIILGCDKDSKVSDNPYLQNFSFSTVVNLNLPSNNQLLYVGSPVLITDAGAGIKGIFVMRVGAANDYRAYEASCPSHYPSECSLMSINGINAKCSCENFEYSLYTGLGNGSYPLKQYRIEVLGSNLRVYN